MRCFDELGDIVPSSFIESEKIALWGEESIWRNLEINS